jgi:hypothetical protein
MSSVITRIETKYRICFLPFGYAKSHADTSALYCGNPPIFAQILDKIVERRDQV